MPTRQSALVRRQIDAEPRRPVALDRDFGSP